MDITIPHNWTPRNYQLPAWNYFSDASVEGQRAVLLWHRRAGKDLFSINLACQKMIQRVGLYWHMLPTYKQGKKIVWQGFTRDGRKFLDHFPKELIKSVNNTEMRVEFKNGSIYQVVGTDDVDSLVGTNPIGIIFSEYSLHNPRAWDYVRPILAENGGWACFIYTARGRNHGHKLYQMSRKNHGWFGERLVAGNDGTKKPDGSPVISDKQIQDEREAGMSEAMIQQEFFNSFEAPFQGAYYGDQLTRLDKAKQITDIPYEPLLPVNTAWDIGLNDATAIWFYQKHRGEFRFINYWEDTGQSLHDIARLLKNEHPYSGFLYNRMHVPHDMAVREFTTGRTRMETARKLGLKLSLTPKHAVEEGIESVRNILPQCWFDKDKCEKGLDALKAYRKEYDDKTRHFKSKPLHDWASHGADAFRSFAYATRAPKEKRGYRQRNYLQNDDFKYI